MLIAPDIDVTDTSVSLPSWVVWPNDNIAFSLAAAKPGK
jgi:hypothetical protein